MFDPDQLKQDFPIFQQKVHGQELVYLDNAATSQKPAVMIEAISQYYRTSNANVHRGVHALSDQSTLVWEAARKTIADFVGASSDGLIIVRNTTEATNGVAYGWGDRNLTKGDVILSTVLEHHSNLVVWQQLAQRTGAQLQMMKLTADDQIDLDALRRQCVAFGERLKLISFVHVSNTLGVLQPVAELVLTIKEIYGTSSRPRVLIDAAQSVPHLPFEFKRLGVDFAVFSGHKVLGPMGWGGLLVRREIVAADEMKPWLFGGGMISSVAKQTTEFHPDLSERFTAGTPDVASAVGMAAACVYLSKLGMHKVAEHDRQLISYALEKLEQVPDVVIVGPKDVSKRVGSIAFLYRGVHAHDVAQILDSQGIAVRSGHHCTMPLHQDRGWQATVRASFQVYNTKEDIDALVAGLAKVKTIFTK